MVNIEQLRKSHKDQFEKWRTMYGVHITPDLVLHIQSNFWYWTVRLNDFHLINPSDINTALYTFNFFMEEYKRHCSTNDTKTAIWNVLHQYFFDASRAFPELDPNYKPAPLS